MTNFCKFSTFDTQKLAHTKCTSIDTPFRICTCSVTCEEKSHASADTCYIERVILRATSHTRLRARDHYTSSTLIAGKIGAGPSSLHTTFEGPTKYVNARWMESLHGFIHDIKRVMFHGHLDYFKKPPLGGRPNAKLGDHGTPNAHHRFYHA